MTNQTLRFLVGGSSLLLAAASGCATGSGSGSTAPFQGAEAVKSRQEAVLKASDPALECLKKGTPKDGGMFEAVADASGKLVVRSLLWKGDPALQACIIDTGNKQTLPPLPGPSVGAIWEVRSKDAPAPGMPSPTPQLGLDIQAVEQSIASTDVASCAQRNLPQDFPADIEITFVIMPGGKPAAVNVTGSSSKDGGFDTCVQQAVAGKTYPDTKYEGPFPMKHHFHVGGTYKL